MQIVSFIIDEILNLYVGIFHIINYHNLVYEYIDYFELNQPVESFTLINYIVVLMPISIILIIISIFISND